MIYLLIAIYALFARMLWDEGRADYIIDNPDATCPSATARNVL